VLRRGGGWAPCSDRSKAPARRAHSSKPATVQCGRQMGQSDRRTPYRFTDPRTNYAGNANKTNSCKQTFRPILPRIPSHMLLHLTIGKNEITAIITKCGYPSVVLIFLEARQCVVRANQKHKQRIIYIYIYIHVYTVIHNYGNPYQKWNIFVARPHLWLQLGMVKPEIMLCETVLNLSTLNTLTYLRTY